MKRVKRQVQQQIQEQGNDNPQQNNEPKKMSQMRDYICMKAMANKNKKKQSKKGTTYAKNKIQQQNDDDSDQSNMPTDPVALLSNYTSENYNEYMQYIRSITFNDLPNFKKPPQQLLDALALFNTNICIYGFGSKIQYINNLVDNYLGDRYVWEVNGYRQGMKQKKVYDNFGKFLKQAKVMNKTQKFVMDQQLVEYKNALTKYAKNDSNKQLVVVFHCIDSLNFLNYDAQFKLSQLFSLPKIKLICSVDNIKIASIWSPQIKTKLNLKFFQIDTKIPNDKQQFFRPNATDSKQQQDQALDHIFQSLNNNQKRILKLFAKQELDNLQKEQPDYYTLQTLLEDCIDNVILSNDIQLRQNLYELIDHKVIVLKQKQDNADRKGKYYTIQCNRGMLDKIYKEKIEE